MTKTIKTNWYLQFL